MQQAWVSAGSAAVAMVTTMGMAIAVATMMTVSVVAAAVATIMVTAVRWRCESRAKQMTELGVQHIPLRLETCEW